MVEKIGKEHKMRGCTYVSSKFGTLDRDNPSVMYVSGRCWAIPTQSCQDQDMAIRRLRSEIKTMVNGMVLSSGTFMPRIILDIDFNYDKPVVGKKKKLTYDLYLRQKGNEVMSVDDLYGEMCHISSNVESLITDHMGKYGFDVEKSKTI